MHCLLRFSILVSVCRIPGGINIRHGRVLYVSYIFEPHKNPQMNGVDIIYILKQGFSNSSLLTLWLG